MFLFLVSLLLIPLALTSNVYAHASFESNLEEQSFLIAPEAAEFTFSAPVVVSTATGQLRFLGDVGVSPSAFFDMDVPTVDLVVLDSPAPVSNSIAFTLPPLEKGSYALDWEVVAEGDHASGSTQLFEITEGVSDTNSSILLPALAAIILIIGTTGVFIFIRKGTKP